MTEQTYWRVVVRYDDPRGGTWYGPVETLEEAQKRLTLEQSRVHGRAWIEQAY